MSGVQAAWLPGGRLHLQHGPIDLILSAEGDETARRAAFAGAMQRFDGLLAALVAELPALRRALGPSSLSGPVARRMEAAVRPHGGVYITPMAAVAGAVADETLAAMTGAASLRRAWVNNGGDVAVHLAPGERLSAAIFDIPHPEGDAGRAELRAEDAARGIATSGWRGRSLSLGIADAVTVLAPTAAAADAAATLVANAVDLPGHPAVLRVPACDEDPDSDLGDRPVTRAVGQLSAREAAQALASGAHVAEEMRRRGLICAAALFLDGQSLSLGLPSASPRITA